jgi:CO/xanthine dehydrogenase Mo-binding subunit
MNAPFTTATPPSRISRRHILKSAALTVGFALAGPKAVLAAAAEAVPGRVLDPKVVDAFLGINADGSVTLFSGKVDLGQGLRIGLRQIVAEELGVAIERITMIEGDTALTPDQGRTAGSNGIQQGGVQIRQAAATARQALIALASKRLNVPVADLIAADGEVRPKSGGSGVRFAELLAGNRFNLALDPKAPLKDPRSYTLVGKVFPRPDIPAKVTGTHTYVHDITVPGMLHGRVIRPPALGADLLSVDESSIASLAGAKVVRIKNFLAVVAEDEWTCVRAMRALKAQWSEWSGLPTHAEMLASLRAGPFAGDEAIVKRGEAGAAPPADAIALNATYYWPIHTHGSIGPSCAVADVKPDRATIWTASQGTHGNNASFARLLGLPRDKVRLIYVEGSGCYGMNGHEDAAADAAILSRAVGRPVRVQWMRHDEHGWDPKGPPQLLDLAATVGRDGRIVDWRTDTYIPQATRGLPNVPLVGPEHAGMDQPRGISTGQIQQNLDPPYAARSISAVAHWLKDTPLRPAPIRSPGKPGNCFAVESFVDELAAAAKIDPVAMRLQSLSDPRGVEVIKRVAAVMKWEPRTSPRPQTSDAIARGRGFAYLHYKHAEAYVAMGMEVAVERASGLIQVERVVCAHDCGLMVAPDGVRSQVEGSILQTLSRVLMEEVTFDRAQVTSVDWSSYPILRFSQVPRFEIALIDRPTEKPVGAGEASSAPVGAALGNAIFDATGVRLRTLPFTPDRVKGALGA